MSKPVSNVEIEDVLSSIRRLVSSSDRAEREEQAPNESTSDKLVLTPSLRVDEGAENSYDFDNNEENQKFTTDSSCGDVRTEETHGAPDADQSAALNTSAEAEFLELVSQSAASEDDSDDLEGVSEDGAQDRAFDHGDSSKSLDDILADSSDNFMEFETRSGASEIAGSGMTIETAEAEQAEHPTAAEAPNREGGSAEGDDLRHRAAKFESIIAEKDDQWDPDGSTQDENAAISGGPVPWQENEDEDEGAIDIDADPLAVFDQPRTTPAENDSEPEKEDNSDSLAATHQADTLEARDAVLEKMIIEASEQEDAAAARDEDDSTLDADTVTFAFKAHDRTTPPPEQHPFVSERTSQEPGETVPEETLAIEEALLDEEALRDMVSDIVRQELQGALGERITRNVRKLVRREIHRALASQQLE